MGVSPLLQVSQHLFPWCPLLLPYSLEYMGSISNLYLSLNHTNPSPYSSSLLPTRPSSISSVINLHPIRLCTTAPPGRRGCCHRDGGTGAELGRWKWQQKEKGLQVQRVIAVDVGDSKDRVQIGPLFSSSVLNWNNYTMGSCQIL